MVDRGPPKVFLLALLLGSQGLRAEKPKSVLANNYELQIKGISEINGSLFLQGDLQGPNGLRVPLDKLKPGQCCKNICFTGLADDGKNLQILYLNNGEWKTLSVSIQHLRAGERHVAEIIVDPSRTQMQLLRDFYEMHKAIFPQKDLIGDSDIVLSDGQWTSDFDNDSPGTQSVSELLAKINRVTVAHVDGVPVLGPATEDCNQFRAELIGKSRGDGEDLSIDHFEKSLVIQCRLPSGRLGYCSHFIPRVTKMSQCIEVAKQRSAGQCGDLIPVEQMREIAEKIPRSPLEEARVYANTGKPCRVEGGVGALILITKSGRNNFAHHSSRPVLVELDEGISGEGVCHEGKCVPANENNFCSYGSARVRLQLNEDEFQTVTGKSASTFFESFNRGNEAPNSDEIRMLRKYFAQRSNREKHRLVPKDTPRDGIPCIGGICQRGQCVPVSELLRSPGGGRCLSRPNGESCTRNGVSGKLSDRMGHCYEGECLACDPQSATKLVGAAACPKHPLHSGIGGVRLSCSSPDICDYAKPTLVPEKGESQPRHTQ